MTTIPPGRTPRSGHAPARLLAVLALGLVLIGCTAIPRPTVPVASRTGGTTAGAAQTGDPGEVPALLLWEDQDGATVLRRTERGDPTRWRKLGVPAGWTFAAAPDSGHVVAIRSAAEGGEVAFGTVTPEGVELGEPLPDAAPEVDLEPACVDTDGPAAFLAADANGYLVAFRDGGWASVDAIGTLGDCAWLDSERLLTVGQGAGDPMTLHSLTAASAAPSDIGGTDPSVSGGLLVARDRSVEPWQLVHWPAAKIDGSGLPPRGTRLLQREPGTRYLEGVASPDGRWLAIKADRARPDGMTSSLLVIADLRDPAGPLLRVLLDFPLAAVSWPD